MCVLDLYICINLCVDLQDSSTGNASDMESQEGGGGGGGQGHKSKVKDRTSTPSKDQRHAASLKATPGYKVEDKTT